MALPLPALRVLLLHNRYRERGGEERAVEEIAALLGSRGHRVEVLERSSEALAGRAGGARGARALLAGGEDPHAVAAAVQEMGAQIVHAHNLHPLLGYRALDAARRAGARTVLQLHNFRLYCSIGVAFRDGRVCHHCHGRDTRPAVRHRCRGGAAESVVYAAGLARQQPRLIAGADRIVCLSHATRGQLGRLGLPPERCDVLSNPLRGDAFAERSDADAGSYALCVGRLSEEKGFEVAVRAARRAGVPLKVAGAGPEAGRLAQLAAGSHVELLGRVEGEEMARLRAGAAVLLAPSRCEEQSPYAVLEAMAAGVPVLASSLGGLPELAGAGSVLAVDDVGAWASALAGLWADPAERRRRGEAALARARERAGPDAAYQGLMGVYASALAE